ncbi:MAG: hypothetical protein M1817_000884 [Caeruleum heppii]|nr:MAG: hypothetical protein M1817_000884 [Caeruleum heppii]
MTRKRQPWRDVFRPLVLPDGPLRPFRLLRQDLKNLRSRYVSDWTLFNQLVFASAVYVFFTNLLPGITFASDLYNLTGENWGTIEVPLTILGVTGPFSILAENIYSLCVTSFKIPFLPFMAWSLIHACWMHYLLAILNAHDYTMRYVTTFSTEIFSLLNSIIYIHKAVQELQRAHANTSLASFLYSVIGASGTFLLAVFLSTAERWKPLFHRYVRMGLTEYAAAISIVIFIGMPRIGELSTLDFETLHVSKSFRPSSPERSVFLVRFWELPLNWTFAAIIPGLIITVLFFFDHEVSSIICTIDRYGTKKPGGFAWDVVLLGTTTALCGILGIPPANGLLPQAPLHSESLLRTVREEVPIEVKGDRKTEIRERQEVYEQRWSHFLHAGGILMFISPPFMHVLGLTPTSVLAGLFLFMGQQSLSVNPILSRTFHLLTPSSALPPLPSPLTSYRAIHAYTLTQILVTAGIFIITLTKAAPAFPVFIIALVPVRLLIMNKIWTREVLGVVDGWACRGGEKEGERVRGEDIELSEGEGRRGGGMMVSEERGRRMETVV